MTESAILQMVQDGKLGIDDPISKYVEGVPNGGGITISQLLKMRSGLFNFTDAPEHTERPRRARWPRAPAAARRLPGPIRAPEASKTLILRAAIG